MFNLKHPLKTLISVFIYISIFSCSTIPTLNVTYRIPSGSRELTVQKSFLSFEDARAEKNFIGKGARDSYKHFSGLISFYLVEGEEKGSKIGVCDVPFLFKEAFNQRLEKLGVFVVKERKTDVPVLTIILRNLRLDLIDGKWFFDVTYELKLVRNGKLVAEKTISGEGERLKLIGTDQADILFSELFTDSINKIDLIDFFKKLNS